MNAVAANSLKKIGMNYGYEFAKEKFGLSTLVEDDIQISSLALGAQYRGVTVREMASAFATFANKGVYRTGRTWTKVYDRNGNVVIENTQESREVLSKKAVNYTNYCLTNAVRSGTGGGANFASGYVAGKTGTTSSARDRWFCGYTNYYTAAVWCGFDTPARINLSFNPASRLFKQVMQPLHKGLKNVRLYDSGKMSSVTVCLDSGKLATDACKSDVRGNRTQTVAVYSEDRPSARCDMHVTLDYCATGDAVANEYCKKTSGASIVKKSLLKLTQKDVTEILKAKNYGLDAMFLQDNYVYLVTESGKDASFKGFKNNINSGISSPYKVCTKHTQANVNEQGGSNETTTVPGGTTASGN